MSTVITYPLHSEAELQYLAATAAWISIDTESPSGRDWMRVVTAVNPVSTSPRVLKDQVLVDFTVAGTTRLLRRVDSVRYCSVNRALLVVALGATTSLQVEASIYQAKTLQDYHKLELGVENSLALVVRDEDVHKAGWMTLLPSYRVVIEAPIPAVLDESDSGRQRTVRLVRRARTAEVRTGETLVVVQLEDLDLQMQPVERLAALVYEPATVHATVIAPTPASTGQALEPPAPTPAAVYLPVAVVEHPDDYQYLTWVWKKLDVLHSIRHWTAELKRELAEQYKLETGRTDPYTEDDNEEEAEHNLEQYKVSYDEELAMLISSAHAGGITVVEPDEEDQVPQLVRHIVEHMPEPPRDCQQLDAMRAAVTKYYAASEYLDVLSHDHETRSLGRTLDAEWEGRVLRCFGWAHELRVKDPEVVGTTNRRQYEDMCTKYTTLVAVKPDQYYEVTKEDEGFTYEGAVLLNTETDTWGGPKVTALLRSGHVVGVFCYPTQEQAEVAQYMRLSPVEPHDEVYEAE